MESSIFIGMKTYTIKLEDKAAFINALKSISIGVDSYNIIDDEIDKSFEVTFKNQRDEDAAKSILSTHKGIDQLKEMLRRLVREEISR